MDFFVHIAVIDDNQWNEKQLEGKIEPIYTIFLIQYKEVIIVTKTKELTLYDY